MRLLIVSSRFPFPIEKGDKLRLYNQIRQLASHFEIHLFALTEHKISEFDKNEIEKYCKSITIYKLSKWSILFQLIRSLFCKEALQLAYFKNKNAKLLLDRLVKNLHPDRIYCQLLRSSYYVEDLDISKTIDLMDAFSFGMQSRGNSSRGIKKMLYLRESKILKKKELEASKSFNNCVVISKQDQLRLHSINELSIVNNGVDLDFFQLVETNALHDIIFVGNLGYYPNVQAVKYIIDNIIPLYSKIYDANLNFAAYGARPAKDLIRKKTNSIHINGWIEDIREAYKAGKILVAPIFGGMGQQNKILESMALGIPCIVTPEIANGINARHLKEVIVCDKKDDFCHGINTLLNNESLYSELRDSGRKFVEENFSWENSCKKLVELIKTT